MSVSASADYKTEAEEFMDRVHEPTMCMLDTLAKGFRPADKALVLSAVRDADKALRRYRERHPELSLKEPDQVSLVIESCFDKLAGPAEQKQTIIVVNNSSYPSFVSSFEQRQAWDSFADIAKQNNRLRSALDKSGIDWSQGHNGNYSYFNQSWIQAKLKDMIQRKRELKARVEAIRQVDGMTNLGEWVDQMLSLGIDGMTALSNSANYPYFSECNDQINRLQRRIWSQYRIKY